jgi:hypothetical protein
MNWHRVLECWGLEFGFNSRHEWLCVFLLCLAAADPPSKESYWLWIGLRNWKANKAQQRAVDPIIIIDSLAGIETGCVQDGRSYILSRDEGLFCVPQRPDWLQGRHILISNWHRSPVLYSEDQGTNSAKKPHGNWMSLFSLYVTTDMFYVCHWLSRCSSVGTYRGNTGWTAWVLYRTETRYFVFSTFRPALHLN